MGDEASHRMNLDLNLGPGINPDNNEPGSGLVFSEPMSLEEWLDSSPSSRETLIRQRASRQRLGQRWRSAWRPVLPPPIPPPTIPPQGRNLELELELMGGVGAPTIPPPTIPPQTRNLELELMGGVDLELGEGSVVSVGLELGEGSVAPHERVDEESKVCATNNELLENEALGKKDDVEKNNGDGGSFFDCNICLDQATEPVVTSCGHLFCWPCLYQWLHLHSDVTECPVCKGEVTMKNLTPIYGRGNDKRKEEDEPTLQIPQRPQAQRIEGWRQTFHRNAFEVPMDEMIRRIGLRYDLSRDMAQPNSHPRTFDNPGMAPDRRNFVERRNFILNRFMAYRGLQREQNAHDPIDLSQSNPVNSHLAERLQAIRRTHPHRAAAISNFTSAFISAERVVDSYLRNHSSESIDDRDSVSSIAAVIHSESQTVDTTLEIDSRVSHSRRDASRSSDVDSGDSRAPTRRRLN